MLNKYSKKSIILISDGQLNVGTIENAIEYAKARNVQVNTIAVGTREGGQTSYGISTVDEDSLKSLAYNTGGLFFFVTQKNELRLSLKKIAEIEPGVVQQEITSYLIIISIILFFIEYALINAKLMEFP